MKMLKSASLIMLLLFSTLLLASCSSDDDNNDDATTLDPLESCQVQLFDGDNFKDDQIVINGPGEFSDLSDLPNSDEKDWTDEADSFRVGEHTTVTVWTAINFEGDSTVYEAGDYPSVDEPYSLKITCQDDNVQL